MGDGSARMIRGHALRQDFLGFTGAVIGTGKRILVDGKLRSRGRPRSLVSPQLDPVIIIPTDLPGSRMFQTWMGGVVRLHRRAV